MGRDIKRVPLDFDAPRGKVWAGYLMPGELEEEQCSPCEGMGYSPEALRLRNQWWGYVPFDPADTGSEPFTVDTPEVRAFAERNVGNDPGFYGSSDGAIVREARRLLRYWNTMWQHHLSQGDVDVLVAEGELREFTHTYTNGEWEPVEPAPTVTAERVNRWSIGNFMAHNCSEWPLIKARCKALGVSHTCVECDGHGSVERYPGQRLDARLWKSTEPPKGEGWQLWETTSEGSPQSPVFATPEELAGWCEANATVFGQMTATYGEWYRMITGDTLDVDSLMVIGGSAGPEPTFLGRATRLAELDPDNA